MALNRSHRIMLLLMYVPEKQTEKKRHNEVKNGLELRVSPILWVLVHLLPLQLDTTTLGWTYVLLLLWIWNAMCNIAHIIADESERTWSLFTAQKDVLQLCWTMKIRKMLPLEFVCIGCLEPAAARLADECFHFHHMMWSTPVSFYHSLHIYVRQHSTHLRNLSALTDHRNTWMENFKP